MLPSSNSCSIHLSQDEQQAILLALLLVPLDSSLSCSSRTKIDSLTDSISSKFFSTLSELTPSESALVAQAVHLASCLFLSQSVPFPPDAAAPVVLRLLPYRSCILSLSKRL